MEKYQLLKYSLYYALLYYALSYFTEFSDCVIYKVYITHTSLVLAM